MDFAFAVRESSMTLRNRKSGDFRYRTVGPKAVSPLASHLSLLSSDDGRGDASRNPVESAVRAWHVSVARFHLEFR